VCVCIIEFVVVLFKMLSYNALSVVSGTCFSPEEETRNLLYRMQVGPQGLCGRVRKISPSPGLDPPTVHPVSSRYTG
jgi:hypothetical protein